MLDAQYVKLDSIRLLPSNPKQHDIGAIISSIKANGFIHRVIINSVTGDAIGGNGRVLGLRYMRKDGESTPDNVVVDDDGDWCVPVDYCKVDKDKQMAVSIALNRMQELGGWDEALLAQQLKQLAQIGAAMLEGIGFDGDDIDKMVRQAGLDSDDKQSPFKKDYVMQQADALLAKYQVKLGDVWQLDKHRLVCGDCTEYDVVRDAYANILPTLCITDPPYNVDVHYVDKIGQDKDKYIEWCKLWCRHLPAAKIIFTGVKHVTWWDSILGDPQWMISWIKRNGQGRTTLGGVCKHDPILLYNVKPDNDIDYIDMLNDNTDHLKEKGLHQTTKPVELYKYFIKRFGAAHDAIFDPFVGSGTCLVACNDVGKKCVGIDVQPLFISVCLDRIERSTNIVPQRLYNLYDNAGKHNM